MPGKRLRSAVERENDMVWDGLIVVLAVVLCVNGWNRGLLRSWRGPLAMIAATLITQRFYIDFSTWIMSRLRIAPEAAVVIGYLMLWFSIESVLEITISMLVRGAVQQRPLFFDRAGGVLYGLAKTSVIVLLPLMALSVELKIPPPPEDLSGLQLPSAAASMQGSLLMPGYTTVAHSLLPMLGNYVVSLNAPSFTPTYPRPEQASAEEKKPEIDKQELENLLKQ